jgi:ubiquinone/menaquinone biosynthesis C-methylase UbiE
MEYSPQNNPVPPDLKDRLRTSYNTIAPTYNEWTARNSSIRLKYLDKLIPHLTSTPIERHVLELGSGAGIPVTQKLAAVEHILITANDISSAQIEYAKQNLLPLTSKSPVGEKFKFIEADMMSLEFPVESFDAVIAMYSLIHLPIEDQSTIISRIAKWLKPGGHFLGNFSTLEDSGMITEQWLHEKGWMFWSGMGVQGTVKAIKNVGLHIELQDVSIDVVDADFLWILARK